jgi:hypothetical protein
MYIIFCDFFVLIFTSVVEEERTEGFDWIAASIPRILTLPDLFVVTYCISKKVKVTLYHAMKGQMEWRCGSALSLTSALAGLG